MSRLTAIENINKKYTVGSVRPFGGQDPSSQVFSPNSVINRGTPISQTIVRPSQVISNIPGGNPHQVYHQESVLGPPGIIRQSPVVETIVRTEVYQGQPSRRISMNESRGVRPKEYWQAPAISRSGDNTPVISRVRRGYVTEDGGSNRCRRCCNWSCCLWAVFIGLLLIAAGFLLFKVFGNMFGANRTAFDTHKGQQNTEQQVDSKIIGGSADQNSTVINNTATERTITEAGEPPIPSNISDGVLVCPQGFFQLNGKCLSCPDNSLWNGTNCIVKQVVNTDGIKQSQKSNTTSGTVTAPEDLSSGSTTDIDNTTDQIPAQSTTEPVNTSHPETSFNSSGVTRLQDSGLAGFSSILTNSESNLSVTGQPINRSFESSVLNSTPTSMPNIPAVPLVPTLPNISVAVTPAPSSSPAPTPTPEATPTPVPTPPTPSPSPASKPSETLLNPNNVPVLAHLKRRHLHL